MLRLLFSVMKLIIFLLSLLSFSANAQQQTNCYISEPIDIKQEGWNKVLCMKNGNTLLFHFDINRPITIKVFDTAHKLVASQNHLCKVLDINELKEAIFLGIYDINNEAVLFLEQTIDNKHALVRVRFNCNDGAIIEEKILFQSASMINPTVYTVMKDRHSDDYAVFCYRDIITYPTSKLELCRFNGKHELLQTIPLDVDTKDKMFISQAGADMDDDGSVCITLDLLNIAVYAGSEDRSIHENSIMAAYLPRISNKFYATVVRLGGDHTVSTYTRYTYNKFSEKLELLLLNQNVGMYQYGLMRGIGVSVQPQLLLLGSDDLSMSANTITSNTTNAYLQSKTDTNNFFIASPSRMITNENGLTSIISIERLLAIDANGKGSQLTYNTSRNIGITQCNNSGKEINGLVLPVMRYTSLPCNHLFVNTNCCSKLLFNGFVEKEYEGQFTYINTYAAKTSLYILYNDAPGNLSSTLEKPGAIVQNCTYTDAFYYKIDSRNQIVKRYLFGKSDVDESKSGYMESCDFNATNNTYAMLMLHRQGKKATTCMAWGKLE